MAIARSSAVGRLAPTHFPARSATPRFEMFAAFRIDPL
jgi:hypothetical protein